MQNNGHTPIRRHKSPETMEDSPSSFSGFGKSIVREASDSINQLGETFMDQLLRKNEYSGNAENGERNAPPKEEPFRAIGGERITVFSLREQRENQEIQEIKELLKQIKKEIAAIKHADNALAQELKDVEKLTVEVDPKHGLYHVRFLEVVLKLLSIAHAKISESGVWLSHAKGKRKRGGHAYNKNAKEKGTQYSQSLELSGDRSTM